MFGSKTRLVGLDIGSKTIKAAEVIDGKKGYTLSKFGLADIPAGMIEDGAIKDPEGVAETIRGLFKTYGIKNHRVALSIGGYSVIVKKISVQTASEEQLQDTIQFEAEQYIPFDINDVNLDFQILGENENNPNQMNVLLVAAKKEMVNDYVHLAEMAGLEPRVIDVDAFALQNVFEINYEPTPDENVALIDIGASKTSLNILKGDVSVFMRDVSLGCGQINQKIAAMVDCSLEEAEAIKFGDGGDRISAEDLSDIISSVVTDWCTEIRRALDFFYSTYPDDQIKKIVLGGGGGNIQELRQLLAVETSAEVQTINPFQRFFLDSDRFDTDYLEKIAPQASICMGLATRRVDDK
ncbi:type IV pilus biogenesis protein PilM [Desulfatitalea alkaliphila]|uniref:Pilus assembly protein PilM n=1 Tax=Desulfatitalea alkaliphila TaxID=2929485 RepID=A0AA41R6Z6_9BACT|nr:type IV pilus assembly protein PilM [Desulfatitalea alkaliphila]MCJ8502076.1 pilus assembly protein PilM [Desulfatitalea alkaliphila]